jgi:hypothetical protein
MAATMPGKCAAPPAPAITNITSLRSLHNSINDLGYIQFDVNSSSRTFKIISDGFESLTLRTTGLWPSGSSGGNQSITLYLTRVGP